VTTGLYTLQGSILSLQASIVSVYGPPKIYFEPLKKSFEFCLQCGSGSRFWLKFGSGCSLSKNVDPDPQPCPKLWIKILMLCVNKPLKLNPCSGSTVDREASDKERQKDIPTFKDNDFLNDRIKISIGEEAKVGHTKKINSNLAFLNFLSTICWGKESVVAKDLAVIISCCWIVAAFNCYSSISDAQ
jgi:hypothetical protein